MCVCQKKIVTLQVNLHYRGVTRHITRCLTSCEIAKTLQRIYEARCNPYQVGCFSVRIFRCLAIPTRVQDNSPPFLCP